MAFQHLNDEALLDALDEERRKFTRADEHVMRDMISELVIRGVYPVKPRAPKNTLEGMVNSYGARWFQWRGPLTCPHCKADLRDTLNGPPFKREIGMYDTARDRTVGFKCPDCNERL